MRLLFDNNLSRRLPQILAESGWDAVHVRNLGVWAARDEGSQRRVERECNRGGRPLPAAARPWRRPGPRGPRDCGGRPPSGRRELPHPPGRVELCNDGVADSRTRRRPRPRPTPRRTGTRTCSSSRTSSRSPGARTNTSLSATAPLCLGARVARLEMRILLEELIPRLRAVELAGTPKFVASKSITGLRRPPITFTTV